MTQGRVILLSNSHSRSFVGYDNIYPVYLGPASKNNITNCIHSLLQKVQIFCKKMKWLPNDRIIFLFGEGSIRYDFKKSLYPHQIPIKQWDIVYKDDIMRRYDHKYYDTLINNIDKVYQLCQCYCEEVYVMSVISSFYPIINKILDFNLRLQQKYGDKFIDIYQDLVVFNKDIGQYRIMTQYLNTNFKNETNHDVYKTYEYDPIHLNNKCLMNKNLFNLKCKYTGNINRLDEFKIHSKFKVIIV